MKTSIGKFLQYLLSALILVILAFGVSCADQYVVADLGDALCHTDTGSFLMTPNFDNMGINDYGQCAYAPPPPPCLSSNGFFPTRINNSGQEAGTIGVVDSQGNPSTHASLNGADLGTLGNSEDSFAWDINAFGQVVGGSGLTGLEAFLYSGSGMIDLGTLGGIASNANGINNSSQIVGYSYVSDGSMHGFLYSGGTMTDLGLPYFATDICPMRINNLGDIVGQYNYSGGFLYSNSMWYTLGMNMALDINDHGQIVGYSNGAGVLYSGGNTIDLNTLIPNSGYQMERGRLQLTMKEKF